LEGDPALTVSTQAPAFSATRLIIAMAAITGLIFLALAGPATAGENNTKWFVCKYVGTPGVNEVLQTGKNPISVSENAINQSPVIPGTFFEDAHGRSYVLVEDTGQKPEPSPDLCPPANAPELSAFSVPCQGLDDTPRIRILGLLVGMHFLLDGNEVVPDANGDVSVQPGTHNWSVLDGEEEIAAGQVIVAACPTSSTPTPEGSQLGGTGTPAPSLQNTALSALGFGGPLATLVFGAILLSSLGALAYANVRAARRRQ
jgi:hypothetical protein